MSTDRIDPGRAGADDIPTRTPVYALLSKLQYKSKEQHSSALMALTVAEARLLSATTYAEILAIRRELVSKLGNAERIALRPHEERLGLERIGTDLVRARAEELKQAIRTRLSARLEQPLELDTEESDERVLETSAA